MFKNTKFELLYSLAFESCNLRTETESCLQLHSKHLNPEKPEIYMSNFLLDYNRKSKNQKSFKLIFLKISFLNINFSGF